MKRFKQPLNRPAAGLPLNSQLVCVCVCVYVCVRERRRECVWFMFVPNRLEGGRVLLWTAGVHARAHTRIVAMQTTQKANVLIMTKKTKTNRRSFVVSDLNRKQILYKKKKKKNLLGCLNSSLKPVCQCVCLLLRLDFISPWLRWKFKTIKTLSIERLSQKRKLAFHFLH